MRPFSHIYIERQLMDSEAAIRVLAHFPDSVVVPVQHYKDIFCRTRQDFMEQKKAPALILAEKKGELIYRGAKVCQSFGNEHFYYTSCIMNCIYNCEYCYLSGMYPSGNIVMFLNIEDYFSEIRRLLCEHEVYLCISYDTDLLALNPVTGFINRWIEFADDNEGLTIEIRTKCSNVSSVMASLEACRHRERIIFAYTVSPKEIIDRYEKGTSGLEGRLKAIKKLQEKDIRCRIAFDPMIYVPDWESCYGRLADMVFADRREMPETESSDGSCVIDSSKLFDVSIGSFRISESYLKIMRKNAPGSALVQFPYENREGVYHYPSDINSAMEEYMKKRIMEYLPENKIFMD